MPAFLGIPLPLAVAFLTMPSILLAKPVTLQIEVYNHAPDVPIQEVRQALQRILTSSSIRLAWLMKDREAPEGQLMVLVGGGKSSKLDRLCSARRSISLRISQQAPPGSDARELGFSLPFAPAGVNVVIYFNRVVELSRSVGVPLPVLLGQAIAHEIGHVLLRTETHTSGDLMTETWRASEFARMRRGELVFSRSQGTRIRDTIAGRSCRAAS